jgi:RNA polymerase sigma-70 factor (ECF subfamily)
MKDTDLKTLHTLYVENRQELYTYALSITRNREAAEDAIHCVFERLLRADSLPVDLRPYVFRSARNAAYDAWRRTKVRTDSIFDLAAAIELAGTGSQSPGRTEDLERLLQQLSPDEREAIVLKVYSGLTFRQIAELREVPLATVASWYRRGLECMKNILTGEH